MIIYTDGACHPNPGIGGYAAVLLDPETMESIEIIAGGEQHTTNSRMELMAFIKAMEHLDSIEYKEPIMVYTDSQYLSRAINEKWLDNWIEHSFKNVKNQDLWLKIWKYICKLDITIEWVKAHNGNKYNEMADRLASEACFFQGKPFKYNIQYE